MKVQKTSHKITIRSYDEKALEFLGGKLFDLTLDLSDSAHEHEDVIKPNQYLQLTSDRYDRNFNLEVCDG